GEFDRLVLLTHGFVAVTSTGGAFSFRSEWARYFREIPEVYVCFDRDKAGDEGARRVAGVVPHAHILTLPPDVGEKGDVWDFFVRLGKTREDFEKLLGGSDPLTPPRMPLPPLVPRGGERAAISLPARYSLTSALR